MAERPTGTVTFLFSDIEGSTRLLGRLRDRYGDVLAEHQRLLRAAFVEHGGYEVGREGDSFFVAFARAPDALDAAVRGQRALASAHWPDGVGVRVRMGIHTGEATVRGGDYVGIDVHRAARISSAAHGGQVLLSGSTHELVADELPVDVALRDLGEHRLKDLERPEHLFQVVAGDLPADFPPPASLSRVRARIPAPPTPTFGREAELRVIGDLVDSPATRLVTITGSGGVGKTRLAVEVARTRGARFVSLASTAEAEHAAGAVCDALDVARVPGETPETALIRMLERERTLLVLDNLEHLVGVAPLLARLLEAAPALTILGTSRQALGLRAERVFPVGPLPLPDAHGANVVKAAAVELFVERARARDPRFTVDAESLPSIVEVCRRVNGLPLGIELAAGRLAVLDVSDLAGRLADALGVLGHGPQDAPARQRTLRATLDWSFGLLERQEQDAFAALAAFAGGGDVEAAEVVTAQPLAVLEALVDKCLVIAERGRLSLMEPVRQYSAEKLLGHSDAASVHGRHVAWFLALAEATQREIWVKGRSCSAFERVHRERDNLRAAHTWCIDHGEARNAVALAGALGDYFRVTSAHQEAEDRCRKSLAIADDAVPAELLARAHFAWADNTFEPAGVVENAHAALAIFRRLGDDDGVSRCMYRLSDSRSSAGDQIAGMRLAREALEHARRVGDDVLIGCALTAMVRATPRIADALPQLRDAEKHLRSGGAFERLAGLLSAFGFHALGHDDYGLADRLLDDAVAACAGLSNPFLPALTHGNRGLAALLQGRLAEAASAFREQLTIAQSEALVTFYFEGLLGFAALAADGGDDELAAALEAAAWDHNDRAVFTDEQPVYDRLDQRFLQPARQRLGADAWRRAGQSGRGLTAEDAIALTRDVGPRAIALSRRGA
jgi:predicted ATPase/class 3 adenylate cyclase